MPRYLNEEWIGQTENEAVIPTLFTEELMQRIRTEIDNDLRQGIKFDGRTITYTPQGLYTDVPYTKNYGLDIVEQSELIKTNEEYAKAINKMAQYILENDMQEEICSKVKLGKCQKYSNGNCIECIKNYFMSK